MKVKHIVVDTNVLVSYAIKPDGVAGLVVDWVVEHSHLLVLSHETFMEFETRLWRPKFDRHITLGTRKQLLDEIAMSSAWVTIPNELQLSRDPDDDKFIETALAASAPVLISGDNDLLELQVDKLAILTPRQFAKQYIKPGKHRIQESSGHDGVHAG